MASYITVSDLKSEYPKVDYTAYSDTVLEVLITRASAKVDDFIEYSLAQATITDEVSRAFIDADDGLIIFPLVKPITTLTSLSIVKGSASVAVTLQDGAGNNAYTIPDSADRVILPVSDITLNSVDLLDFATLKTTDFYSKITYTAGYASNNIPSVVKEATALYVLDTIARGANVTGASRVSQGGISIDYDSRGTSELVKDAEKLLMGYKKTTGW